MTCCEMAFEGSTLGNSNIHGYSVGTTSSNEYSYSFGSSVSGITIYRAARTVPEKVIFNDPATIVFWNDGTKTVVKCQEGDVYDEREGFLLCCAKKLMGGNGRYNDLMRKVDVPDEHGIEACVHGIKDACGSGKVV